MIKAILQMKIEGALQEVWVKTGADSIIVDEASGKTLATALSEIIADLSNAVAGGITPTQVDEKITTAINGLIDGASGTYDTLKEIEAAIKNNTDVATALNTAIGNKVDKVSGKGLSTNDFTSALLTKLNGITEGATKAEASSTNGNIKSNGTDTKVYAHPTGAGNNHLPSGGSVGQVLRAGGSGTGAWGANVRSGASVPSDLAEGELFIKVVN